MIYRHISLSIVALAVALLKSPAASAQQPATPQRGGGGPPAPAPQNLQVLAKDTSQAQVLQIMQNIAAGLGVQCGYCHLAAPAADGGGRRGGGGGDQAAGGRGGGRGPAPFDFASDEKPQKKVARDMMLMVREINPKVASATGKSAPALTNVGCVTCHRGVAIPKQLADVLDQTATEKGTAAAVAQYKDLRKQYFGAQAYDFSETSLITYAQRATAANKADDALAWLQVNLEYFPNSSRTYAGMSAAYTRKTDKDGAIKAMEKAVELDPQNAQTKRQLDQLKAQ